MTIAGWTVLDRQGIDCKFEKVRGDEAVIAGDGTMWFFFQENMTG